MTAIEQAIKQRKFKSMWHKAIVNIFYTNNWLKDIHQELFKSFGLQEQQFNILRILRGQHPEPISPGYIKDVLIDKRGDLTRILDRLEDMGLVTRKLNEDCRRMIDVSITTEGLDLLSQIDPGMKEIESSFGHLTDSELETLSELLDKMRTTEVLETNS